jgi:hypothetical protein
MFDMDWIEPIARCNVSANNGHSTSTASVTPQRVVRPTVAVAVASCRNLWA